MRLSSGRRAAGVGGSGRGRIWVYETYGLKQAQEWPSHSDPATTLRHHVHFTTAARAKAVAGLDEVTHAALDAAQAQRAQERASLSAAKQPATERAD
jgi:hypothetical protein